MLNNLTMHGNIVRNINIKEVGAKKTSLAEFVIACSNGKGDYENNVFLDCKAWGAKAEFVATYFTKGKGIIVAGVLQQENWDDKESGKKRSKLVLNVSEAHFAGGAKGDDIKTEAPIDMNSPIGPDDIPFVVGLCLLSYPILSMI